MTETTQAMTCEHCGNQTLFWIQAGYSWTHEEHEEVGDDYIHYTVETSWRILQCPACHKPLLEEETNIPEMGYLSEKILYPTGRTRLSGLPTKIEAEYAAALKVRSISPSACAVLIGRTLEVMCKHEGVKGNTLVEKINTLVEAERIPSVFADMAHQLRQLRNLGAHAVDDEITSDDVNIVIDFLEAILEYLYIAPARVSAVRDRLKKSSKTKPVGTH